jgi:hypothetical protein
VTAKYLISGFIPSTSGHMPSNSYETIKSFASYFKMAPKESWLLMTMIKIEKVRYLKSELKKNKMDLSETADSKGPKMFSVTLHKPNTVSVYISLSLQ